MDSGLRVLLSTVLCLSQSLLISCSSQYPSFLSEPASLVQSRGSAAHLHCLVSPPSAVVSWRFKGLPLVQDTLPGVELNAGSLTISSLKPGHVGVYQCVAHLGHGPAIASRHARVAIAEISEYEDGRRRSLSVQEGSTVLIECPLPHSVPPALPRLRARGKRIEMSTDDYLVLPSGNLQIISVSAEHQGMYKCGAFNPVTGETVMQPHGTKLSVKHSDSSPPVRIVYPTAPVMVSVQQSQPLMLECTVSGSPAPAAKWLKNGKEVTPGPSHQQQHNNLAFVAVTRSDEGSYACAADTEQGTVMSANYTVNVLEPTSITEGLTNQLVSPGSSARFTCTAKGNPSPNVTWLFNADPITPSHRFQISGSSLVITEVTPQDEGVFQCLLDNGIGSAQSSGMLSTQSGWRGRRGLNCLLLCVGAGGGGGGGEAPAVVKAMSQSCGEGRGRERAGEGVQLDVVPGSDSLRYFNDPQLGSTAGVLLEASPSLHSMQSDEGHERFLTEDEGDTINLPSDRAGDRPTPEAPIIISPPQTHKPDVYDLEWRAGRDGGSPINAYFVKYRKVDEMGTVVGNWHTVRVPGSEKTLRLSELESSSLYEVLMVARSSTGEGQPAMLTFRTGKDFLSPFSEKSTTSNKNPSKPPVISVPPKAPEDKTPNTHFGVVIHDRVQTVKRWLTPCNDFVDEECFSCELAHGFRVRRVCVSRKVIYSPFVSAPVPEAPDRPTISMATESSVYVTWIPRANGGSPITAFRVEYRRGRSAEWVVAADNISPLKLSVEVRNLEPVTRFTAACKCDPSGRLIFNYLLVEAEQEFLAQLHLLLRLRLQSFDVGVGGAMNMYGESPHSIPSKLYRLAASQTRIAGRPVVGPHISSTDAISDTQIMLRWILLVVIFFSIPKQYSPSSNNNTPIQGFYIYYRPTDSDNDSDYKRDVVEESAVPGQQGSLKSVFNKWLPELKYELDSGEGLRLLGGMLTVEPGVKHWHMIGHLQPETSYDIKMQCFNEGGESEYSNVMICETRGSPSQHPITPPGPHPQEPPNHLEDCCTPDVGCVLGVMVLILLAFIAMCLWRNRQQNNMHKYDPPGYLYQPAEMNGHVLEYTTLSGSGRHQRRRPRGIRAQRSHLTSRLPSPPPQTPQRLGSVNGSGSLFSPGHPHSHDGTLPHSTRDCEHSHPPPTITCYSKTNSTFSSGTLPLMHRVASCQQDGLEMVPLGQVSSQCHGPDSQMHSGDQGADAGYQPDEDNESSPSQHSCCLVGNNENCPADNTAEEELDCVDMEGPVVCWESLGLPDLDCDEKPGWISSSSLAGELIQPSPQEV
ncbi:Cell adhesion molecule-related/down-regulated by oncogenes [Collichthys lucidus]|uniref:Cell adhesion molecule-related/down-regulated by oncogenes n=1 Tax=Collichthys lucidus TaxID=240159 RepID=A0A4U5V332_COLLU|nr:Cell adhesion molecule-related/down-regulated by oncogenes [Collichthys lucidus]